jgi:hypothetical protein
MAVLQVLSAGLYYRTEGMPLAALLACGYYGNRSRAKGKTRGVMRDNVTGGGCGGFIPRKVPRLCHSTVLVRVARQKEWTGRE